MLRINAVQNLRRKICSAPGRTIPDRRGILMRQPDYCDLQPILTCPVCAQGIEMRNGRLFCSSVDCHYGQSPFLLAGKQPVMVDFDNSIFQRSTYQNGTVPIKVPLGRGGRLLDRAREFLYGQNHAASAKAQDLLQRLGRRPGARILVIGGGTQGSGASALYAAGNIEIVGIDVFPSPDTSLVADAHALPFKPASFDAVWIQAVLEHVIDPQKVVTEIHRVLKSGGLVYADTPFMQQVHAGAYDFQRFTASGHRWLFRHFAQIDAGSVGGPAVTLIWSLRYFLRGLGIPERYASILTLPFFWLRIFDRLMRRRPALDGACGLYFYGASSQTPLKPQEIVAYYESQSAPPVEKAPVPEAEPAPAYAASSRPAGFTVREFDAQKR